ncbi:MAG: hypothetical protein J0L75_03095 [Spirochaetes bacterium]|nr:hypothetical protein [Spirochaetota bacterium]
MNAARTRKSLLKLEAGVSKLTRALEGLLLTIEEEEKQIQTLSQARVRAVEARMSEQIRALKSAYEADAQAFGPSATRENRAQRKNAWRADEIARLKESLQAGKTIQEVAAELGRKATAVRQRAFQEGIRLRELRKTLGPKEKKVYAIKGAGGRRRKVAEVKPWTPEELSRTLGLLAEGTPLKEVALQTGRPFNAIRTKLKVEGIRLEDVRKGWLPKIGPEDPAASGVERFMNSIIGETD